MRESVGSPGTEKGAVETPADGRAGRRGTARSGEAPVTRRARRPMDAAAAGTCRRVPSPKRRRAAVANSKVGMGKRVFRAKTQTRKERKVLQHGRALWRNRKGNPRKWPRRGGAEEEESELRSDWGAEGRPTTARQRRDC